MEKTIEIPEGYEARIEGNKVIIAPIDSEDERIRKMLVKYFEFYRSHPDLTLDVNTWQGEKVSDIIAYLEKQKEKKPAEWSEEDEKMHQALIHDLGVICEKDYPDNINLKKGLDWLKSLRPQPHWKPSKEQMEALQVVIEHGLAVPNREASLAEGHIESLYRELKKLL